MDLPEALKITGAVICQFEPDDTECGECCKDQAQLYYIRTCYESDEGEYYCEECIKKLPDDWSSVADAISDEYYANNPAPIREN